MLARFAVALGRGSHRHALRDRSTGADLVIAADLADVLVVADQGTPVIFNERATLIGQLFASTGERIERLDRNCDALRRGDPPGCWGNFALFEPDQVYRDPSGSIPVYQLPASRGGVFVSDATFAETLGSLERPSVDHAFAVHWLQFPYLRSARAGLEAVREVLPGTLRRRISGEWIDQLGWDPWEHLDGKNRPRGGQRAANALRSLALLAVGAQVSATPVLLQLSGGVDSSIIAACLHHAKIPFSAVTFATRSADGDERRHARCVARAFGIELEEISEDELPGFFPASVERGFRPGSNPLLLPLDQAIEQHRRKIGAECLIDGGGGDNLFSFLTSAAPVADALLAAGPRTALATAQDVAELADCSIWQVARAALGRTWPARRHWKDDRSFLNPDALLSEPDPHPWLRAPVFTLPGKLEHVESLVHIQHFLDRRLTPGVAALHPLLAQPLIELCLSIPSWLWVRGGRDRAIARDAFGPLLPPSIMARRSKGSLQGLFHRAFERQRTELRDSLLSGELRSLAIIDPSAVERAFTSETLGEEVQLRLSEMAALELWLQSWRR